MNPRRFGYELALIATICVIGIFLFPASAGSYSAVHGPVTALQAMRNAVSSRWALAAAALSLLRVPLQPQWCLGLAPLKSGSFLESSEHNCILRC
jgi:hypothetical protein